MKKILLFIFLVVSVNCYCQVDRTFWFAAPKCTDGHGYINNVQNISFKITAMNLPAVVTISMPNNTANFPTQTFTVAANQSYIAVVAQSFPQFALIYDNTAPLGTRAMSDLPGAPENRGFLITATNDITVYYDYDNYWNRELYPLKGSNALGTEFYMPFQNIWGADNNGQGGYNPKPYSAIDIVASVDNTTVTVTPPALPLPANPATPVFQGYANNNPITFTLNQGQTFSLVANSEFSYYHPTGTHIVSNQPIAVTENDDTQGVAGDGCYDANGDQLVPVSLLGSKYLVMTGTLSINPGPSNVAHNTGKGEEIFVCATNTTTPTTVNFYGKDGTLYYTTAPLSAGQSDYYSVDIGDANKTSIFIQANENIYVWHITCTGCEMGGAILPPITNCTGSTEVGFYRSATVNDIQINLMIPYNTAQPFNSPTQSYNYFTLYYSDGTAAYSIPGSWFEPNIPAGWAVLQFAYRNFDAILHSGQAHQIVNTKDFFHLGLINGTSGVTNKYGYFSSYNVQTGGARVASTSTTNIIACLGDTIILAANGGLSYNWTYAKPDTSGGLPTYISNPTAENPQVFPPVGNSDFYVDIHRSSCFGDTIVHLNAKVLAPVTAAFQTNQTVACAPSTVQFTDQSIDAINYYWSYQQDNNPVIDFTPANPKSFSMSFNNKTFPYTPSNYTFDLVVDDNEGCSNEATKQITIYPEIIADMTVSDTVGCNPLPVNFSARNSGGDTLNWTWEFGDQGSSKITNPSHSYLDYSPDFKDTIYHAELVASSAYFCTDTVRQNIHVYPNILAGFTVDTVKGCSPIIIQIFNTSQGAISQYNWNFGDGSSTNTNLAHFTHTYINNTSNITIYPFKLTVFNKFGCTDTLTRFITVYPQTNANFTENITEGCNPLTVNFTNPSNKIPVSYLWNFGDGSSSLDSIITHQFINSDTTDQVFKTKLTVNSANNCTSYDSTLITVHAFLNPSFTLSSSAGCTPYTDTITNKSTGGIKTTPTPYGYTWIFGDGSISNSSAPVITHYYQNTTNNVINTSVSLTIMDKTGLCTATLSRNITLYPEITADYSANTYTGCNPLTIDFSNLSNPPVVATNYVWDFNDGSSSILQNPVHVFNNTSSTDAFYQVKMIAISANNCKDSVTKVITVYPFLSAMDAINKPTGCSPDTVTITDGSQGGITNYFWNYGDGNQDHNALPTFTHVYTNTTSAPVTYTVQLIVQNHIPVCEDTIVRSLIVYPQVVSNFTTQNNITAGCDSLTINFINSSGPAPVPVKYDWNFGDGGSSSLGSPSHLFVHPDPTSALPMSFYTKLYAYSQYNCANVDSQLITVYPFIKADFSIAQPNGCSPLTIAFTDSSSPGVNGYLWQFGNGVVNNNPSHTFTETYQNLTGGVLTVTPTLTVTYNGNCASTISKDIQVYPQVTADFTQDTLHGCQPLTIDFTNTSLYAQRYDWSFGDLGTSVLTNPSHNYTNFSNIDSVYTVNLLAISAYNCTNMVSKQVTIYPKPKARFNVQNSVSCPPFQLSISNLSEAGNTYVWSFGDGSPDTTTLNLSSVNHTYDNFTTTTASYPLKLSVKTNFNCTDSTTQIMNVYPRVIAGFVPDTSGCSDLVVQFRNQTTRGATYLWNFGDGVTSNLAQPSHDFYNLGINDTTYQISMISYSGFGCIDSSSQKVTVYPQPKAAFSALPAYLDYPASTVDIDNETNPGNWNYLWNFGDGNTAPFKNPINHTYAKWGHYTITLTTWSNLCRDSVSARITVVPPVPIADFDMSANVCQGLSITFTDKSTWATQWNWNFGDSATSTQENPPPHIFPRAGIYHVQLIVTGDGGTDVITQDVQVYALPQAGFTPVPTTVQLPNAEVKFYNNSQLGVRYLWNFGDSTQSTDIQPTHTYNNLGYYTVSLDVWSANNCFDSVTIVKAVDVIGGGIIRFPNVFTPNPNGPNGGNYKSVPDANIFYPYAEDVVEYHLEIYDRWGEKLFQTDDINVGWDGYYKGSLCKGDVYIWMAKGKFTNGQAFNLAGDVTLLK